MLLTFFQDSYFLSALVLIIFSIYFFQLNKVKSSLCLLTVGSFMLGLFMIHLDPFLNLWDEQFHALVAKNMLGDPLTPILIKDNFFGYIPQDWSNCNVWTHKQPLFLWQMALSMKLFGQNEIAIRIPSLLMHTFLLLFIFRIGCLIDSVKTGYYSALLFTCAYFPLEFISGFYATDHNDMAFLFYTFLSLWSLFEYIGTKKIIFVLLLGLFAGFAVLCKWLTGMLVYSTWFILLILNFKKFNYKKELFHYLLSICVCFLVFIPWQVYSYLNFPQEYLLSLNFNNQHILEVIEGHEGTIFFYLQALYEQIGQGELVAPLVVLSFGLMIYQVKNKSYKTILLSTTLIIYVFFSLVSTKMYGYVICVFPFLIISIALNSVKFLEKYLTSKKSPGLNKSVEAIFFILATFLLFNPYQILRNHGKQADTNSFDARLVKIAEKELYLKIKSKYTNNKCFIFNCTTSPIGHIPAIFYSSYPSLSRLLSELEIAKAKAENYTLIAIDNGKLPDYVLKDKEIVKCKF